MKRFRIIMILAVLTAWGNSAIAETKLRDYSRSDRVALVIGNAKYEYNPLQNPVNDARSMSSTLLSPGFKVSDSDSQRQKAFRIFVFEKSVEKYDNYAMKKRKS